MSGLIWDEQKFQCAKSRTSETHDRSRVSQTFAPAQNPNGGFGGGHGQISHCAPSYAAILSLAIVGGTEALEMIDRRSL